jgi:hypothetical protein
MVPLGADGVSGAIVPPEEAGGVAGAVALPLGLGEVGAAGSAGAGGVAGAVVVLLELEAGGVAGAVLAPLFSSWPQLASPTPANSIRPRARVFDFIACSCSNPQQENATPPPGFRLRSVHMPF